MLNAINITKTQNKEYSHEITIKRVYTKHGGRTKVRLWQY